MLRNCNLWVVLASCGFCVCGCTKSLEEQASEKSPNFIVGKKTQDIGEYKPEEGLKVSDSEVKITNMVTGPLEAYGPMMEKLHTSFIKQAVDLYHAEHGEFPKTYEEFMEKIVKPNNIKLPVLPGTMKYQYDVANHRLVVVDAASGPAAGEAEAPATP